MIEHCNRWLLGFAAAYLALLPTNTATFVRSVAFGGAILFMLLVVALARRSPADRIPFPGWPLVAALAAWAGWSLLSLAWTVKPAYSESQLEREIGDSLIVMAIFYVAARDARGFRTLAGAALASLAVLAAIAIATGIVDGTWDAGRFHHGVGPWSTWTVLVAPLLVALIAPPPAGFANGARSLAVGLVLVAMMVITDRMTDNRIVWIALAGVFGTASLAAALRWPRTLVRTPLRWVGPLAAMLVVLGIAFTDAARERAAAGNPPEPSVTASIEADPRIALWESIRGKIEARPWTGYGFGRRVLADQLAAELHDPLLVHAHNAFASQWLQTGAIGMLAFVALLVALVARYARFLGSRDDTLAFVGIVGIALVAGFVVKNLTDDFLFRSNAKEFWALGAMLLGYGMRREATVAAGAAQPRPAPDEAEPAVTAKAAKAAAELVEP
ncbi:MAG: O-antigen ligase family protein [Casimicrobiaceae bacterium]